jgi:hypothetical protein
MSNIEYQDLEIRIRQPQPNAEEYLVHATSFDGTEVSSHFKLPFQDLEIENLILKLGRARPGSRHILTSDNSLQVQDFGERLFRAVFDQQLEILFRTAVGKVKDQGKRLRIRLRLNDAPALADLPWEYLWDYKPPGRFLMLSSSVSLVRYLENSEAIIPRSISYPVRIAVMISNPEGSPPLNVESEWRNLKQELADLENKGFVQIDRLEPATLSTLNQQMRRGKYQIFHFIGHGGFDVRSDEGQLLLEREDGKPRLVSALELSEQLQNEQSLQLIVLNACEGARASKKDAFAGVSQKLVGFGIPFVIAMQLEISDKAAITFARVFYEALVRGDQIDDALTQSRVAIRAHDEIGLEFGNPVLYTRSSSGTTFESPNPKN